jgi:hypothetical protein
MSDTKNNDGLKHRVEELERQVVMLKADVALLRKGLAKAAEPPEPPGGPLQKAAPPPEPPGGP